MGMLFTEAAFDGELPTREALQSRLAMATGLQVQIETIGIVRTTDQDDPSKPETEREWQIHFESVADSFKGEVWVYQNGHKFHVQELADSLNRCPNYLLFAVEVALINLGGTRTNPLRTDTPRKDIPDYAFGTFEEWKHSNHGAQPPIWKVVLAGVGMILYVIVISIACILMLPFLLLTVLFFWLRERRRTA